MFHKMPRKVEKIVWGSRQLLYRIGSKLGIPPLGNGWFEQDQPDPGPKVKVRVVRGTPVVSLPVDGPLMAEGSRRSRIGAER